MANAINLIISDPVKRAELERYYWPKVKVGGPDECWEWLAFKWRGYGRLASRIDGRKVSIQASRIAFALENGQIGEGLFACHSCDNPGCCNPKHLFLGTHKNNMEDAVAKGRMNSHLRANPPIGEKHPLAKITEEQAMAIIMDGRSTREIAFQYGLRKIAVRRIQRGVSWSHLPRPEGSTGKRSSAKITPTQALEVFNDPRPTAEIAKHYGIHIVTVRNIKRGDKWSAVTGKIKNGSHAPG